MSFDAEKFLASFDNYNTPQLDEIDAKKEGLSQKSLTKREGVIEKAERMQRNKNTVVGMLDLDTEGLAGQIINRAVATVAAGRDMGNAGKDALFEAFALAHESPTTVAEREAFARQQQGIATDEDIALLNRDPLVQERGEMRAGDRLKQVHTARELAKKLELPNLDGLIAEEADGTKPSSIQRRVVGDAAISALKGAIAVPEIAVGLGNMVSGGHAGKAAEEAGFRSRDAKALLDSLKTHEQQAADKRVHSAEGFSNTLETAIENPSTIVNAVVESIPSMLAGGVLGRGAKLLGVGGKSAGAFGEGTVMAGTAAENIRQQTKDGLLSGKQIAAAAATGALGASIARVGGALASKTRVGDLEDVAMGNPLPKAEMGGVPRVLTTAAIEGGEELAQSAEEQILQNYALDRKLTQGVGNATAMGLLTGVAMGGGMSLAQSNPENTSNSEVLKDIVGSVKGKAAQAAKALNIPNKAGDIQAAFDHAKTTGEVDRLVDAKDPAYDPAGAIRAMHEYSQRDDADTEGLIEYGEELVSGMELQLKQRIQNLENSRELTTPEHVKEQETQITQTREELAKMKIAMQDWRSTNTDIESLDSNVELANTPVKEITEETAQPVQAAVRKSLTLAMRDNSSMTPEQMEALASNTENSLDDSQRTFLARSAAARRAATEAKTVEGVSEEVFKGGNGNLGLENYQSAFNDAHANGDNAGMRTALAGLQKFAASHRSKFNIFSRAFDASEAAGGSKVYSFLPKGNGKWVAAPRGMSWDDVRKKGGVNISAQNSGKILDAVQAEVTALEAGLEALKAKAAVRAPKATGPAKAPQALEQEAPQATPKVARPQAEIEQEADVLLDSINSKLDPAVAEKLNLSLEGTFSQQQVKAIKAALAPADFEALRSLRNEYRGIAPAQAQAASAPKSEPQAPQQAPTSSTPAPTSPAAPSQPNTRAEAENTINVWYGSNENAVLSNLAERPFRFNGVDYLSVEHAYQSLKSGEFDQATYNKYTAGNQKIAGRKGTKTEGNWNLILMRDLVLESFKQNPEAREALLATGDAKFSHTQDRGVWKTEFPRILESVRRTLRRTSDTAPASTTESQNESQVTNGLEGGAPRRSSPSFLAPIEDAVESFKKIPPLVSELDALEQSVEKTTDKDARLELEDKAEILAETIGANVDGIVERLIDQLDNLPAQVADAIRDKLLELKESDDLATYRLRDLSAILREARYIANSTGDLFGNSIPQQSKGAAQSQAKTEVGTEQASQAAEQPTTDTNTNNFDEEVGIVESEIEQKKQEEAEAREAEEQARRSQTFLESKGQLQGSTKSDYLGQVAGKLKALAHKVPAVLNQKNYTFVNLVSAYFKQVGERQDSTTPRPLVAVKNFMHHLNARDISVNDFLAYELTEAQAPLVSFLMANHDEMAQEFIKVIQPNLDKEGRPNTKFYYRTLIDFFRDANGQYEENFITALVAGAVAVLAEDVNAPNLRTDDEINSMLGVGEDANVPSSVKAKVRPMLARRSYYENKLGTFAYEALGFKEKDENTPVNQREALKAHLGAHMLNALVENGKVELHSIDLGDFLAAQTKKEVSGSGAANASEKTLKDSDFRTDIFVKLRVDDDFMTQLKGIAKGTGGILSTLFGIESGNQLPLLEAPKITQKDTNDGKQTITKSVRKAMEKMASRQMTFRPSMKVLSQASRGFLEDIAGIENVDKLVMHSELRDGAQAANDNLRRELDQLIDLWDFLGALGNPFRNFYARPDQWKNSRIGYVGSWANMQTSKIARFLVAPAGWETTVVPSGKVDKGQTSLKNFKLRVLEGLGAKTDSKSDYETLKSFDETVSADHIKAAVKVLQRVVDTDLKMTTEEENIVANATKKVGNKLHGFEALWALAQYENAKVHDPISGQYILKPFTTMVSAEIDGKTNGPMLSMWLLGVIDSTFAAMGGFFTHASGVRGFGQWKPGNYDLYERTSAKVMEVLTSMNLGDELETSLFNLLGSPFDKKTNTITKAGRDLVKNPLTTLIYGSGLINTVDKMTDVFVENIYKQVAQIHEGKRYLNENLTIEQQWDAFQKDMKVFLDSSDFVFPKDIKEALNTPLSDEQMGALRSRFKQTVGKAVSTTINTNFEKYMTARKQMVRQANVTWSMYEEVRTKLIKDYTEFLMDSGDLPYQLLKEGTVRQPLRGLTAKEQKEALATIKHLEPRINTALSKRDKDLESGIFVGKSARKMVTNPEVTTDVKGIVNGKTTNHKSRPVITVHSAPGVSVMANGVQSTDGNTIVEVLAHLNAIGVHDAILTALHDAAEAGQMMNQQVMELILNHSLPRESYEALARTMIGYAEYMRQNPDSMSKESLLNLLRSQKDGEKKMTSFTELVRQAAHFAHKSDFNRLDQLSKMAVVDQYTIESGIFDVPNSFNNLAAKKRDELKLTIDPALMAAAMEMDKALFGDKVPGAKPAAPKAKRTSQKAEFDLDAVLQTPGLTAEVVIAKLLNNIGNPQEGDVFGQLYREILKRGLRQLKGLPVIYVTDESQIPENAKGAYGWYHVDEDGNASIGIRGSNLAGSGITTELMVHEILHALVAAIIEQAEKGNGTPEVLKAVAELEEMRKFLEPRMPQFGEALKNVQEFVAWGMTNPAFQKALVAIPHTDKRAPNLLNKAQQFFSTIARIVFGKKAESMNTMFTTFMSRVAVIMGDAETNPQQSLPGTQTMAAQQWNAVALFEGLGSLGNGYTSPAMQERVAGLMSSVVDAVGGPFQSFYQQAVAGAQSPVAVMATAQANGLLPNSGDLRASGFALGDQQAFAIEMLTESIHEVQRDTTHEAEKQLLKLFKETSQKVTPADLGGQTQWDALFGANAIQPDGKHLARFAAMALAYPPLASKMGFTTQEVVQEDSTLYGRMLALFEKLINLLAKATHKAYAGQRADLKLNTITERLVALEAKYQARLQHTRFDDVMELLEDKSEQLGEGVRDLLKSGFSKMMSSNVKGIKQLGTIGNVVAEQRVGEVLNNVEKLYNRMTTGQMGLMGSLFDELRGTRSSNVMARALLVATKVREKLRQDIQRDFTRNMSESFAVELNQNEEKFITSILLRNDVQSLMGPMTLAEIQTLLDNPSRLTAEFNRRAANLPPHLSQYFLNQIDYMGFMLATGSDKGPNTVRNIENLARLSGTAQADTLSEAEVAALIPELDVLVTLKALEYSNEGDRRSMARLLANESARTDGGNGIKAVLLMHRELLKQAKERTFVGTERLMVKGYVPEIHNPNIELVAVDRGDVSAKIAAGYKKLYDLPMDESDVYGRPKTLMVVEKMAVRRLSGTLSLTSMKHQGSAIHSGIELFDFSGENGYSIHANKKTAKRRQQEIAALFTRPHGKNLVEDKTTRMTPVMNANGEVVNYRYMMDHQGRDEHLERNNHFGQVLGTMASQTFDKATSTDHNSRVIDALHQQWTLEQSTNPEAFIMIGPDSADASLRERYVEIPYETRKLIESVWGGPNMMVRRELVDLHFGYHKASLTDLLTDNGRYNGVLKDFFLWLAKDVFNIGERGLRRILKAENIIQAVNQEIKDFFVVKSGVTTFWNIVSNMSLLKLHGVSLKEIVRYHRVALKGARDWQRDDSELRRLTAMRDSWYIIGSPADLDQQIAILEDQLARNPVREVMALGMMPTIAEDMDTMEDPYSYKSYAARKTEKYTQYVPNFVKQGAKWVYMTHDTKLYQIMSQGTQMSDFVARYTLFQHLQNRRNNPLSMGEAAVEAIDSFINYDLPSNRWLQYANDMGIVRFTKYYLRIQSVLMRLYQQNPARAMFLATIENLFDGMQTVMDSSLWNRIGSPLEGGPFDAIEALESGLMARALGKVF